MPALVKSVKMQNRYKAKEKERGKNPRNDKFQNLVIVCDNFVDENKEFEYIRLL